MFAGHFAVGLAAKKYAPKTSILWLFFAAQFIDLLWPILLMLHLESVVIEPGNTAATPLNFVNYPYSHSLLMVVLWALAIGLIFIFRTKNRKESIILALLVLSHWFLDLFVHRPDLPSLVDGGPKLGFGIWNSIPATIVVELTLVLLSIVLFIRTFRFRSNLAIVSFALFWLSILGIWLGGILGPPPPSVEMIAMAGNLQWLFVIWGGFIDRSTAPRAN